jgi:hypothetical protein
MAEPPLSGFPARQFICPNLNLSQNAAGEQDDLHHVAGAGMALRE